MEIGQVVLVKAGRDKGKAFIVVGSIDESYVYIANGKNRTMSKPKKKKIKHLEIKPEFFREIKEKIESGKPVFDDEIRKCLDSLGYEK